MGGRARIWEERLHKSGSRPCGWPATDYHPTSGAGDLHGGVGCRARAGGRGDLRIDRPYAVCVIFGPGSLSANSLDMRYITHYGAGMIRSIRQRGLKRLYEDDDLRGVLAEHVVKLRDILARLDAAASIEDMDVPGLKLHALKGELKSFWAVTVRANWRVIFRIENADVWDVDYLDYH